MKETKELMGFGAQAIKTGYDVAEDGKVDFNDLSKLLPLVFAGQEGIGGISEVPGEQANIGVTEKQNIHNEIANRLSGIDPGVADDWNDALMGLLSIYRIAHRAGKKDGAEAVLRRLEAGEDLQVIKAELAA